MRRHDTHKSSRVHCFQCAIDKLNRRMRLGHIIGMPFHDRLLSKIAASFRMFIIATQVAHNLKSATQQCVSITISLLCKRECGRHTADSAFVIAGACVPHWQISLEFDWYQLLVFDWQPQYTLCYNKLKICDKATTCYSDTNSNALIRLHSARAALIHNCAGDANDICQSRDTENNLRECERVYACESVWLQCDCLWRNGADRNKCACSFRVAGQKRGHSVSMCIEKQSVWPHYRACYL